jgi:hypothetical protein
VKSHEIQTDIDLLESNPLKAPIRRQNNWKLLFCPKEFYELLTH